MIFQSELNPGDTAYYEIMRGFIVPVKILEVETWFGIGNQSYQYSKNSQEEYITYSSPEFVTSENSWGFCTVTDKVKIDELLSKCTSQGFTFYWIDEPVGHSIELGFDGLHKTLDTAFKNASFAKKRETYRRHKKVASWRKESFRWIYSTQEKKNSNEWLNRFNELNKKLIYVKV